jgi:ADP-ribose pyrophosphatase
MVSMATKQKSKTLARVISTKTVFRGRVFRVDSDEVIEPGGVRVRREIVRHPGSVVIAALNDAASTHEPLLLLERQYRYSADARLWELPAGRIDPGENDLAAAKRELLEETGCTARKWQRILKFYPSPGFLDELMYVFIARGLSQGQARPEDDERITVHFVPLKQAVQMALSGRIIDGKTLASLMWLNENRRKLV